VMGIFNAPRPDQNHALAAVRAAWQISQTLMDDSMLQFRVGVNTGWAVVGNIGTPQALNYTAIGDAVNRAKRLQEMAKPGQLLISESSMSLLPEGVNTRSLGVQMLRGKTRPVEIFEVIGFKK
jgi:adenylate cyclase